MRPRTQTWVESVFDCMCRLKRVVRSVEFLRDGAEGMAKEHRCVFCVIIWCALTLTTQHPTHNTQYTGSG